MADSPEFTPAELALFEACLACCTHYFEWGTGTSTIIAAQCVKGSVTSVDSSEEWITSAKHSLEGNDTVEFIHVDIGPVGAFGYPINDADTYLWPAYPAALRSQLPDLVLIDGRFRIACALQSLCLPAGRIFAIHDYAGRPHYHAIAQFAREIARAERLSVFSIRADFDRDRAMALLDQTLYDPR